MLIRTAFALTILLMTSVARLALADDGAVDTDAGATPATDGGGDASADGRDGSADGGDGGAKDAAPVVLLPDGEARELIADDEGCGCAVDGTSGSAGAAILVGALLLVTFTTRRRGRS